MTSSNISALPPMKLNALPRGRYLFIVLSGLHTTICTLSDFQSETIALPQQKMHPLFNQRVHCIKISVFSQHKACKTGVCRVCVLFSFPGRMGLRALCGHYACKSILQNTASRMVQAHCAAFFMPAPLPEYAFSESHLTHSLPPVPCPAPECAHKYSAWL